MSAKYTSEDLLEYIKQGFSITDISNTTGLSHYIVTEKLKKVNYRDHYKKRNGPEPKISDDELINMFNSGKTAIQISKESNTDPTSIRRRMKRLDLNCRINSGYIEYPYDFKQMIVDQYLSGKKSHKLREEFSIAEATIIKWVRDFGYEVVTNPQTIELKNKSFFEIPSKESAYFMGLFITDGGFRNHSFSIYLKNEDGYILRKFAELIGSEHKFLYKKDGTCGFTFKDRDVSRFLTEILGLPSSRKTYNMQFPHGVFDYYKDFIPHLIRGIIDGDGCIHYNNTYFHRISICSYSGEFCINLKNIISTLIDRDCGYISKRKGKEFYSAVFSGGKICRSIIPIIYDESDNLRLERKYEKALSILSHLNK